MNSLSDLRARAKEKVRKSGPPCHACILPKETLDIVRQLNSEGLSLAVIAATLQEDGVDVKAATYGKHFREHERR